MDVWTLGEKLKQSKVEIDELKSRIDHIEIYLNQLTEVKKDEAVPVKKTNKSGVRARRRTAKKS